MGRPAGRPILMVAMRPARSLATYPLLVVIAFAALSWGDSGSGARTAGAQETVAVAVGDFFFCDPSLAPGACQTVVSVGDTVTWEYLTGSEGHTVTDCGDSCDTPTDTPLWDSGGLTPGQTFSYTFNAPGTYRYLCRFHPEAMRAEVLVVAPPTATATQQPAPPTATATQQPAPPTAKETQQPAPPTTTATQQPAPPTTTATQPAASPTASPTSQPSPSPTPSPGTEDDSGGVASWVLILAGIGGGVIVLGAGVLAFRRFR